MIITKVGSRGSGSDHTPQSDEFLVTFDNKYLTYSNTFYSSIKRSEEDLDKSTNRVLATLWEYYVFYGGKQLFHYHSTQDYILSETNIPVSNDQLEAIVIQTHKQHQEGYESHRIHVLEPIKSISSDTIQQIADQLQEVFRDQLE